MRADGRGSGIVRSAHTTAGRKGGSCGFHVVRFLHWRGRQRRFRERSVQHVAFGAVGCFDLHVAFHSLDNLHGVAALELGGDVEIGQGFVHPNAIFVRRAFDVDGAAGFCRRNRSGHEKREENSGSANHFASKTDDCWRGRVQREFRNDIRRRIALA